VEPFTSTSHYPGKTNYALKYVGFTVVSGCRVDRTNRFEKVCSIYMATTVLFVLSHNHR